MAHEQTPEKLLYKYVSAKRALACLPEIGNGTLRATQPSALNDPFECSAQLNDSDEENLLKILNVISPKTSIDRQRVNDAIIRWGSLFWQELLREQLSQRFGILSFASEAKNPLLWAHYTKDGSGFAIGYSLSILQNLVEDDIEILRAVSYTEIPPIIEKCYELGLVSHLQNLLLTKSNSWCYEQEWRLIKRLSNTSGTGQNDDKGQPINLLTIPNESVKKVYYTERTPKNSVKEIERRLQRMINRFGVRQATKLRLKYTSYSYEPVPNNPFATLADLLDEPDSSP